MNKEESLRAQAAHNIPCFIHECPLHETCLHWLTGQYYGGDTHIVTCVNPNYPTVNSKQCTMYQKDEIVKYAVGMMHIFDTIPISHRSYHKETTYQPLLAQTFLRISQWRTSHPAIRSTTNCPRLPRRRLARRNSLRRVERGLLVVNAYR